VLTSGKVVCWGLDRNGWGTGGILGRWDAANQRPLDDGNRMQWSEPHIVQDRGDGDLDVNGFRDFACGKEHCCVVLSSGLMKCWGTNYRQQIGYSSGGYPMAVTTSTEPFVSGGCDSPIDILPRGGMATQQGCPLIVSKLWAGGGHNDHTCAITTSGETKCWGANDARQQGDRHDSCTGACANPATVSWPAGFTVDSLSMSRYDTLAVSSSFQVAGMGKNEWGELGISGCGLGGCNDGTHVRPAQMVSSNWLPSWVTSSP
jgi:alpha-tubulin suppressor-like RCC1 family protein